MKSYLYILIVFLTFLSCKNNNCNIPSGGYEFQFSATLTPQNSTFVVGDTISIVSEFSDTLLDRATGRSFVLENWGFLVFSNIIKIDTVPAIERVDDYFDLLPDERYTLNINQRSDGSKFISTDYNYENNSYSLAYKFIAKKPGLYYFGLGAMPDGGQSFEGMCNHQGTPNGFMLLNEGFDNNIELLIESPDEYYNTWLLAKPEQRFHAAGGYVFRVEE